MQVANQADCESVCEGHAACTGLTFRADDCRIHTSSASAPTADYTGPCGSELASVAGTGGSSSYSCLSYTAPDDVVTENLRLEGDMSLVILNATAFEEDYNSDPEVRALILESVAAGLDVNASWLEITSVTIAVGNNNNNNNNNSVAEAFLGTRRLTQADTIIVEYVVVVPAQDVTSRSLVNINLDAESIAQASNAVIIEAQQSGRVSLQTPQRVASVVIGTPPLIIRDIITATSTTTTIPKTSTTSSSGTITFADGFVDGSSTTDTDILLPMLLGAGMCCLCIVCAGAWVKAPEDKKQKLLDKVKSIAGKQPREEPVRLVADIGHELDERPGDEPRPPPGGGPAPVALLVQPQPAAPQQVPSPRSEELPFLTDSDMVGPRQAGRSPHPEQAGLPIPPPLMPPGGLGVPPPPVLPALPGMPASPQLPALPRMGPAGPPGTGIPGPLPLPAAPKLPSLPPVQPPPPLQKAPPPPLARRSTRDSLGSIFSTPLSEDGEEHALGAQPLTPSVSAILGMSPRPAADAEASGSIAGARAPEDVPEPPVVHLTPRPADGESDMIAPSEGQLAVSQLTPRAGDDEEDADAEQTVEPTPRTDDGAPALEGETEQGETPKAKAEAEEKEEEDAEPAAAKEEQETDHVFEPLLSGAQGMEGTGLAQSASEEGQEGEVAGKKEDQERDKGEAEKNKQEGEEEATQEDKGENLPALVLPEEHGEEQEKEQVLEPMLSSVPGQLRSEEGREGEAADKKEDDEKGEEGEVEEERQKGEKTEETIQEDEGDLPALVLPEVGEDEEDAAELTQEAASLIEKTADVADETAAAPEQKPVEPPSVVEAPGPLLPHMTEVEGAELQRSSLEGSFTPILKEGEMMVASSLIGRRSGETVEEDAEGETPLNPKWQRTSFVLAVGEQLVAASPFQHGTESDQQGGTSPTEMAKKVFEELDRSEEDQISKAEFEAFSKALKKSSKTQRREHRERRGGRRHKEQHNQSASPSRHHSSRSPEASPRDDVTMPLDPASLPSSQALPEDATHRLRRHDPSSKHRHHHHHHHHHHHSRSRRDHEQSSGCATSSQDPAPLAVVAPARGEQSPSESSSPTGRQNGTPAELASKVFKDGTVSMEQFQVFQQELATAKARAEAAAAQEEGHSRELHVNRKECRHKVKSRSPRPEQEGEEDPVAGHRHHHHHRHHHRRHHQGGDVKVSRSLMAAGALGTGSESLSLSLRNLRSEEDGKAV